MENARVVIGGIVKDGMIIPQEDIKLTEGAYVSILIPGISPELQAEFDAWELASDEDFAEFEKMMLMEEGDESE
jgi:hypothetical protein